MESKGQGYGETAQAVVDTPPPVREFQGQPKPLGEGLSWGAQGRAEINTEGGEETVLSAKASGCRRGQGPVLREGSVI